MHLITQLAGIFLVLGIMTGRSEFNQFSFNPFPFSKDEVEKSITQYSTMDMI